MKYADLRILYMGTPEFAVPALEALAGAGYRSLVCATQPDRPVGRKQTMTAPPVKIAAEKLGIPVRQWKSFKEEACFEDLRSLNPELIISCAYGLLLPRRVLELPRLQCLNIHPSILPRFRGAAPVQAAIMAGDRETGVSIMRMDEGLDSGDILALRRMAIDDDDDAASLGQKLAKMGAELLLELLPDWIEAKIQPCPQTDNGCYAPKLSRQDGELDFRRSAGELCCHVRAAYPWPSAYGIYEGKKIKILRAIRHDWQHGEAPGTILPSEHGRRLFIACGAGVLEALEIQPESGRRMAASELAHNFKKGSSFAPVPASLER